MRRTRVLNTNVELLPATRKNGYKKIKKYQTTKSSYAKLMHQRQGPAPSSLERAGDEVTTGYRQQYKTTTQTKQ